MLSVSLPGEAIWGVAEDKAQLLRQLGVSARVLVELSVELLVWTKLNNYPSTVTALSKIEQLLSERYSDRALRSFLENPENPCKITTLTLLLQCCVDVGTYISYALTGALPHTGRLIGLREFLGPRHDLVIDYVIETDTRNPIPESRADPG